MYINDSVIPPEVNLLAMATFLWRAVREGSSVHSSRNRCVCVRCGLQAAVPLTQWPKLDIQVHLNHWSRQAPPNYALALLTWVVPLDAGSQGRRTQHLIQTVLCSHRREAENLLLCYFSIFCPLPEWPFYYLSVYLFVSIRMSHLFSKKVAECNPNIPCGMKA